MRISEHCYCLTGLCHSDYFSVNAGFIVGDTETIIVDSGFNSASAQTIYHYAKTAAPKNKISNVINLEYHYDHIFGNGFFIEQGVKIIAHKDVKLTDKEIEDFIKNSNEEIQIESRKRNKEAYIYFKNIRAFEPDIKVTKDMNLVVGDIGIKIILAPGHTETNLIVLVEEDKVLFAGDTIYSEYLPTLRFGNLQLWNKWIDTLETIKKLDIDILVPGHGRVLYNEDILTEINRHKNILERKIKTSS